mgnify:FL=1|jgi:16S rRNA (adenine1518-N6/adenine1519-N6)-dimethyltransferase|tara:strand:+ start:50666 stop:51454 length:789 start_codon:yes stop_codon:yes gene_type:complete
MIRIKNKKKYGQHFLNCEDTAFDIVSLLSDKTNVIEIGPGKGMLTKYLVDKNFDKFIVTEIDDDCVLFLKETYLNKLLIIHDDILKLDFNRIFKSKFSIISNLPYYISSQILFKVLENRLLISEFVILIQKEVGERICSSHNKKSYGILSVLLQTYFNLTLEFIVKPNLFNPPPKVHSAVVKGIRNDVKDIGIDYNFYKNIIKQSFQNRRKTLRNSLKNLNLPLEFIENNIFSKRAEQLEVNEFIWLSKEIKKINNEIFSNK